VARSTYLSILVDVGSVEGARPVPGVNCLHLAQPGLVVIRNLDEALATVLRWAHRLHQLLSLMVEKSVEIGVLDSLQTGNLHATGQLSRHEVSQRTAQWAQ
jgi:hypothetical protein